MRRATFVVLALAIAVVLAITLQPALDRLNQGDATQTPEAIGNGSGVRGLVVLPDDGRRAILDEIERARESIDLYVYLLPSEEVLSALQAAHERGVAVRVILEPDPFGGGNSNQDAFDRLSAAGIDVRWSDSRFQFSHIKTFIVDQRVAVIMTLNLSWSALTRNREFAVVSTVPADVADVIRLFEADWTAEHYQPRGDMVTSPDNSRVVHQTLIDSATTSIEIYAEVIRDADLRERLVEAAGRGVAVRILVPTSPSGDDLLIYQELVSAGVEVRQLADAYSHAKAIIVDRDQVFIGSQNLTQTSLDRNRECGIILRDRPNLDRIVAVFEADWEASLRSDGMVSALRVERSRVAVTV